MRPRCRWLGETGPPGPATRGAPPCTGYGKVSITEFNYRYQTENEAHVFVGIELRRGEPERQALLQQLQAKGYPVVDMSQDETAKLHIRYMVGGHASGLTHESLFRFEFPEYPGALLHFLKAMGGRWNVSLFHYRSHGAAYGRVLMGLKLDPAKESEVLEFLEGLGYPATAETQNPAYRLFASA